MPRYRYFLVLPLLISGVGCNSIFNADRVIDQAMTAYVGSATDPAKTGLRQADPGNRSNISDSDHSLNDNRSPTGTDLAGGANLTATPLSRPDLNDHPTSNWTTNNRTTSNRAVASRSTRAVADLNSPSGDQTSRHESADDLTPSERTTWDLLEQELEKRSQSGAFEAEDRFGRGVRPSGEIPLGQNAKTNLPEVIKIRDGQQDLNSPTHRMRETRNSFPPITPLIQRPQWIESSADSTPLLLAAAQDSSWLQRGSGFFWNDPSRTPGRELGEATTSVATWRESLEATIEHLQEELRSQQIGEQETKVVDDFLTVLSSVESDHKLLDWAARLQELKAALPKHHFQAIEKVITEADPEQGNHALVTLLNNATREIRGSTELLIGNPSLCSEVSGYGKVTRFPKYRFQPGDEVLLYCELENFGVEDANESGTRVRKVSRFDAQIEFLNAEGETDHVKSFADIEDSCENTREDFYLFFRLQIPDLSPGTNSIQIRMIDRVGRKSATLDHPLKIEISQRR